MPVIGWWELKRRFVDRAFSLTFVNASIGRLATRCPNFFKRYGTARFGVSFVDGDCIDKASADARIVDGVLDFRASFFNIAIMPEADSVFCRRLSDLRLCASTFSVSYSRLAR